MKATVFVVLVICLAIPTTTTAQLFGQYTTAAISSEGEGAIFANAGDDKFQTGATGRFLITSRVDFGVQFGYARECGVNSFGAGIDFKVYLLGQQSTVPVDLAIDGYYGHLRSSDYRRNLFGIGLLVSGVLQSSTEVFIEPYASFMIITTYFKRDCPCPERPHCFWPEDNFDESTRDTDPTLRGGVNIGLSDEHQLLIEVGIDGTFVVGAALNIVF